MKSENSIFVIYHIEGFDHEGETKSVVATRMTSKEEVEKEVLHLNNTVNDVIFQSRFNSNWKYFDFEELSLSNKGSYDSNFVFSSNKDGALNNIGMRNMLIANFDNRYNWFISVGHLHGNGTLKEHLEQQFSIYLTGDVYFSDLINVAKSLYEDGLIKTNIENILSDFNNEDLYNKLSCKFNTSIKKKAS